VKPNKRLSKRNILDAFWAEYLDNLQDELEEWARIIAYGTNDLEWNEWYDLEFDFYEEEYEEENV